MAETFLGEIRAFSCNYAPRGWAECNGQLLPIATNQPLFSLLGTTYGGDGVNNFALPDLRGRVPVHPGNGITLGQASGESAHTLTTQEMPAHNHLAMGDATGSTSNDPSGKVWGKPSSADYAAEPNTTMSPAALGTSGGSQPHTNMQPYSVLTFCIATTGFYPPRN
ncbi:phage tail protein [Paenibacillus tuaregi]|uniref:phage tail protein n=1 Tax=Paenibacillus tuaregi TaxID=1816681 RepID=UPI0008380781|nr:tail fiber protein [Paenibacillus tuaregi]